jgi:hypothetical protein
MWLLLRREQLLLQLAQRRSTAPTPCQPQLLLQLLDR